MCIKYLFYYKILIFIKFILMKKLFKSVTNKHIGVIRFTGAINSKS
jgi:hypothetical protein